MEDPSFSSYEYDSRMYTDNIDYVSPNIFLMIRIFNIVFLSITFILGIIGNGLVIWIAGFKMEKTVNILWFLNLAIADFLFVMTLPLQITEVIMDDQWPFGQTMCKVNFTVFFLNMSVSASFLMIISVDRCTSITCPVWSRNHRSPRLALTISAIIWITCFILSSPYITFSNIYRYSGNNNLYCTAIYDEDFETDIMRHQTMKTIRFLAMFLIPFLIIVTCYSLILFRLRRSRNLSRSNRPQKVIITVILCFFCFCFPFHTWPLLEILNIGLNSTVHVIISSLVYRIGFFNSCVNPIVYVFVGRDFKKCLFQSIPLLLENTFKE